LVARVRAGRDG